MFTGDPRKKINKNRGRLFLEVVLWLGGVMLVIWLTTQARATEPEPLPRPASFEASRL